MTPNTWTMKLLAYIHPGKAFLGFSNNPIIGNFFKPLEILHESKPINSNIIKSQLLEPMLIPKALKFSTSM